MFSLDKNPQLLFSFNFFHCGHTHSYSKRSASNNILDIPYSQTYTCGTKSLMHSCIKDRNNLKRSFPNLFQCQLTYPRIKSVLINQHQSSKDHLTVYPFILLSSLPRSLSSIRAPDQFAIESLKLNNQ